MFCPYSLPCPDCHVTGVKIKWLSLSIGHLKFVHVVFISLFLLMTNTLPTQVRLVKAMVFLVVMYGCESWTVKKAERRRMDAFEQLMLLNCGSGEDS